jgi:ribosome-associated heat shock protein Hsp15
LDKQRIDKWLWHARMLRTRSDASAFVEAGHVRVNGSRVTAPGHLVRPEDVVTLALDRTVRLVVVSGFAERRGNATAARLLYRDLNPPSGRAGSPES